jgi:hypothetical protein
MKISKKNMPPATIIYVLGISILNLRKDCNGRIENI